MKYDPIRLARHRFACDIIDSMTKAGEPLTPEDEDAVKADAAKGEFDRDPRMDGYLAGAVRWCECAAGGSHGIDWPKDAEIDAT